MSDEVTQADRELFITALNPCDSVSESVRKGMSFTWEVEQIACHRQQAVAAEVAKIVAWLKAQYAGRLQSPIFLAYAIERGEYKETSGE